MSGKFLMKETECIQHDPDGVIHSYVNKKELVKVDIEPFFFTYSKQILALYGLSIFNATTKVLWKLLEIAEWNTGKVYMTSVRRKEILNICGISETSFKRAIKELVEIGVITKEGTTYTINSVMFWKGDREARNKLIKEAQLKVTFSPVFKDDDSEEKD